MFILEYWSFEESVVQTKEKKMVAAAVFDTFDHLSFKKKSKKKKKRQSY